MNSHRAVIIQARMSSSRLPGKTLMRIGPFPLIYYVIKRLQLSGLPVIVATSSDPSDNELADYLKAEKFTFYRGDLENVLDRYLQAAEKFGVEEIVRVTGDNPLVNIEMLLDSLPLFQDYDYVDGIGKEGLIKGTGFELVKLSALRSIKSNKKEHLEHVTSALRKRIGIESKYISLPTQPPESLRKRIFLTCDYAEDLELLREIYRNFNYMVDIKIKEVLKFLDNNSHLKNGNNFRH